MNTKLMWSWSKTETTIEEICGCVGPGWKTIVTDLTNDLLALGWEGKIAQVKEKMGCYDTQTEVLTKGGWKFFKDCTRDDLFAVLTNEGYLEYEKSTDIIKYHYKGKMYRLEARGISLLVTPNHNLFVAKGNSHGEFVEGTTKRHPLELTTPDKYFRKTKRFYKAAQWRGVHSETITVPGYTYYNRTALAHKEREYIKPDLVFATHNFLKFLGFYTAEGCCNEKTGDISIAACNDGSEKALKEQADFELVLRQNNLPIRKTMAHHTAVVYRIYNKSLARWLTQHVGRGAANKKVSPLIKSMTPDLIRIYLEWLYRRGDGHKSTTSETLYTASTQLSNDVQELLIKVGATFRHRLVTYQEMAAWKEKRPDKWNIVSKFDSNCIGWLKKSNEFNIEPKIIRNDRYVEEWVDYDDTVYCVTVPFNKVFIRRNGKGAWCGNSLRYYLDGVPDETYDAIYDRIEAAEEQSAETCEECGNPGKICSFNGWLRTVCSEHETRHRTTRAL